VTVGGKTEVESKHRGKEVRVDKRFVSKDRREKKGIGKRGV
jgi:hypothetical protein